MSAKLKDILSAARECRWKSGRHDEGRGGREVAESESNAGSVGIGMLGRRQVTPRWLNDPVWRHDGRNGREGQGRCVYSPPGGKRVDDEEGQNGLIRLAYVKINDRYWVWRGHCPRLEHHHIIIRSHPMERRPGKQQQKQQE